MSKEFKFIDEGIIFSPFGRICITSNISTFPFKTSCKEIGYNGIPACMPKFGVVRLPSITTTFLLKSVSAAPRLNVNVVFPTPPLPEIMPIIRVFTII